jgi:hypothetical protein
MFKFSTFAGVAKALRELSGRVDNLYSAIQTVTTGQSQSQILTGDGSPQGVVTANVGTVYLDIANPSAPQIYWKTSNSGSSTGWVG